LLSPDVSAPARAGWKEEKQDDVINVDQLLSIAKRQWKVFTVSVSAFLVLGLLFILFSVPLYTASTNILIDLGNSKIVDEFSPIASSVQSEGVMLSQTEVMSSDVVLNSVIKKLDLVNNPQFLAGSKTPLNAIKAAVRTVAQSFGLMTVPPVSDADAANAAMAAARAIMNVNMDVERDGLSYVLSVSYTSASADLSAKIANAIAEAYLVDKLDTKYEATKRASVWLQARLDELRKNVVQADLAVQKFRADHSLVQASGQLVSDQQLVALNTSLLDARTHTAQVKAEYDRIQQILANGQMDAIVPDVLTNSVANSLRQKYLEASKNEADIEARVGKDHEQVVRLRGEMLKYKQLMFGELQRIAESYQSQLSVAKAREDALEANVKAATGVTVEAGETQVQLRELERNSDAYRNLYQTYLDRSQQAAQQESFPITDARIISTASIPNAPSQPRIGLVMAAALLLGVAFGSLAGAYREFRDRFFRVGDQIRDVLDLEFLGNIPTVSIASTMPDRVPTSPHELVLGGSINSYVSQRPLSSFAEALRSAKIAIDLHAQQGKAKIIGIVSTLPDEGKSTVAMNFAQLLAMQGARTILIDADIRNPGATRAMGGRADVGLVEVLLDGLPYRSLLLNEPKMPLSFLPAVVKHRIPHSAELLSSPQMVHLLAEMGSEFDYIVLDLPPMAPVVDARAISPLIDSYLFVVEWGKTSRRAAHSVLQANPEVFEKCSGVIMNKVDMTKMRMYQQYGSSEYYFPLYSNYYRED
jgi:polysaccharide biosynthesis transport protein